MRIPFEVNTPKVEVVEQAVTASFVNLGNRMDCKHISTLGLWIIAAVNNSTNVELKFSAEFNEEGLANFDVENLPNISLWTTTVPNFNKLYRINVSAVNYITVQTKAGIVGTTAAKLSLITTKSEL